MSSERAIEDEGKAQVGSLSSSGATSDIGRQTLQFSREGGTAVECLFVQVPQMSSAFIFYFFQQLDKYPSNYIGEKTGSER